MWILWILCILWVCNNLKIAMWLSVEIMPVIKIFKMNKAFMIILIERNWVGMYVEQIFLLLPTLEGGRGCPWHSSLLLLWLLLLHSSASGFNHSKINRNAAPFSFQKFHITYKQMYKNVLVSVSWILYGDKLSLLWFFIFFLSSQNIFVFNIFVYSIVIIFI